MLIKSSLLAASLLLALSHSHAQSAAPSGAKPNAAKAALTVNVIAAEKTTIRELISANGNIAAWQEMSVGTETHGLRLLELNAAVGDVVKRGQVLARFNTDSLKAEVAAAKANVAEAESAALNAKSVADRARGLQDTGVYSKLQLDQIYATGAAVMARLDAAQAQLAAAQLRLNQTTVLAPDNGVVSSRNATVGAVLPAGSELFRLIRGGRLEWRAEVPSQSLALLKVGQTASITTAANQTISGKVRQIAPTVDPQSRNTVVYIDLGAASQAKAGMFARGTIATGAREVLTVPNAAVLLRDGFSYVFKLQGKTVQLRKIQTGARQGDRVEVVSGLNAGESIVASGVAFLANGDVVDALTPATKP